MKPARSSDGGLRSSSASGTERPLTDLDRSRAPGATPLDPDEIEGLIPSHIRTQEELNVWEAQNILGAEAWIASWRRQRDVLTTTFLTQLHRRMFEETWTWAGTYRRSMKNVSPYPAYEIPRLMSDLVADVRVRYESSERTESALDEIALQFHHRLVRIHPWPNGNGRHARLATDLALEAWRRQRFTWGGATPLTREGLVRDRYLAALRAADNGDFSLLRAFVRS